MQKRDTHHFYLGLFVLTGTTLVGGGVTALGAEALFEDQVLMETYFNESVNGLERGSPVKFNGIPVGKVEHITTVSHIYETKKSYALVRVLVDRDKLSIDPGDSVTETLEQRVRRGLRVKLAPQGLAGGTYMETQYITNADEFPELPIDWLPTGIYIPSTTSTLLRFGTAAASVLDDLSRTNVHDVTDAAKAAVQRLDKSIADLDLSGIGQQARDVLATANRTGADLSSMAKAIEEAVKQVRRDIDQTLGAADSVIGKIDRALEDGQLTESMRRLSNMLKKADEAIAKVDTLVGHADRTMAGVGQMVRGRSRDVQIAIGNLRQVLQNLDVLTSNLEEYPSLLFLGKAPKSAKGLQEGK